MQSDSTVSSVLTFVGVVLTLAVSIYLALHKEKTDNEHDTLTREEFAALTAREGRTDDEVLFKAFQELERQNKALQKENVQLRVLITQLQTKIALDGNVVELKANKPSTDEVQSK